MANRSIACVAAVSFVAAAAVLAAPHLLAQSGAPSAKRAAAQTIDGHPDLSGMYDVATMTPLRRPAEFGGRRALTAAARTRNAAFRASGAVRPDAGESAEAGPAGAFDGPELRPLSERCLLGFGSTSGPPALPNYWYNNLKQVVQTKDSLMILNEMVHDARIVRIGGQHLPSSVRSWLGDSVGHWEGDVLVVDTTNLTDKTQFEGSAEKLHVIERFSRLPHGNLL